MSERSSGFTATRRVGLAVIVILGLAVLAGGVGAEPAMASSLAQTDDDTDEPGDEETDPEPPADDETDDDTDDDESEDDESTEDDEPPPEPADVPVVAWVGAAALVVLALVWAVSLAGRD